MEDFLWMTIVYSAHAAVRSFCLPFSSTRHPVGSCALGQLLSTEGLFPRAYKRENVFGSSASSALAYFAHPTFQRDFHREYSGVFSRTDATLQSQLRCTSWLPCSFWLDHSSCQLEEWSDICTSMIRFFFEIYDISTTDIAIRYVYLFVSLRSNNVHISVSVVSGEIRPTN